MKRTETFTRFLLPGEQVLVTTVLMAPQSRLRAALFPLVLLSVAVVYATSGTVQLAAGVVFAACCVASIVSSKPRTELQLGNRTIAVPSQVIVTDQRVLVVPLSAEDDSQPLFVGQRGVDVAVDTARQLVLTDQNGNEAVGRVSLLTQGKVARALSPKL